MIESKPKKNSAERKLELCEDLYRTKRVDREGIEITLRFSSICRFIQEGLDPKQLSFYTKLDDFVEEHFAKPDPEKHIYQLAQLLLVRNAPASEKTGQKILSRAFDRNEEEALACISVMAKNKPETFLLRFNEKRTALHCALERGYTKTALFLIQHCDVDLTAMDAMDSTALEYAELFSNEIVHCVLVEAIGTICGPQLGQSPTLSPLHSLEPKNLSPRK